MFLPQKIRHRNCPTGGVGLSVRVVWSKSNKCNFSPEFDRFSKGRGCGSGVAHLKFQNISILAQPRKAPGWGRTVADLISSKSIKYLKCTWHSADFTTAAPLEVNGAENLFIYADDRCGTLGLGQWNAPGASGALRESFVLQMKISNPASRDPGSARRGRGSLARRRRRSQIPPPLLRRWPSACADRERLRCASKQYYNVPAHSRRKRGRCRDWVNVSGWGRRVCI